MENDRKKLNLLTPFIALSVIAIIIIVLFSFLSKASDNRKFEVNTSYYNETKAWMSRNEVPLESVFTEVIPESCNYQNGYFSCPPGKDVSGMLTDDIKDYSSIMFLKKTSDGKILSMTLSGSINELFSGHEKINELNKMFAGEELVLPWDEYVYELQGKDVLVPFTKKGKVIGIIVRGVIEK